jgi:hypothetical protein
MCWIGAPGFQNQTEPFSLRGRVRWERGYHTRGVSRAAGPRYGSKDRSESRPYSMWRDR